MTEYLQRLYSVLSAKETLGAGGEVPGLNERGQRLLQWLRRRAALKDHSR
jgi:hypothetical protein